MNDGQKAELRHRLYGGTAEPMASLTRSGNLTRVYAVTSSKGGVGKSSVTTNLAAVMITQGLSAGMVDTDIYGFSTPHIPRVKRVPAQLDGMIVPPVAHGVKVTFIGMFVGGRQLVVWRSPMLYHAARQFLSDVFRGDLGALLLNLSPGTGDVTIFVAQLLPSAEVLMVTTPQTAAVEVAERTSFTVTWTCQKVVNVIEDMSYMPRSDGSRLEVFGSGGGEIVSASLSETLDYEAPLPAWLPLGIRLREGSDTGLPVTVAQDGKPAAGAPVTLELPAVAQRLTYRSRGLVGKSLEITPA